MGKTTSDDSKIVIDKGMALGKIEGPHMPRQVFANITLRPPSVRCLSFTLVQLFCFPCPQTCLVQQSR